MCDLTQLIIWDEFHLDKLHIDFIIEYLREDFEIYVYKWLLLIKGLQLSLKKYTNITINIFYVFLAANSEIKITSTLTK